MFKISKKNTDKKIILQYDHSSKHNVNTKILILNNTKTPPTTESSVRCPYCRLSPCVIIQAPSWLRGSASPNLSKNSKRFKLYRKFWTLLGQLDVWNDPVYLQYKQTQTTASDPREIMPNCLITVSSVFVYTNH
jgi:hypothetical protein